MTDLITELDQDELDQVSGGADVGIWPQPFPPTPYPWPFPTPSRWPQPYPTP